LAKISDTLVSRRRLGILRGGLALFGVILVGRLFYLQVISHSSYTAQAQQEHTRKYEVPASRGEIYVKDGDVSTPAALNQTLQLLFADPRLVPDKEKAAQQIAKVTGGSAADYLNRMQHGIEYVELRARVTDDVAHRIRKLNLAGIGLVNREYRTYPEGQLAAQVLGFVNADGIGQYGVEQYLEKQLAGKTGQLAAKTDPHGMLIATANNVVKPPTNGTNYVLTIDRNIQAMAEQELAGQVAKVKAKSGSIVVMDPDTGAVKAMANYPTYDPNHYSQVNDYSVFMNQASAAQFEPGSGMKAFTMAAGLDQGKVTPGTTYDDPGCYKVDDRQVCDAQGDKPGKGKTMTVVLRDSLNTGIMFVLRMLGGDRDNFTLAGKTTLYNYFTKHFGFGTRTGIEQAGEAAGSVPKASNQAGNNVKYANMAFGQGMSVTMVQMAAAMAAVANGGKLYRPYVVDGTMRPDGTEDQVQPKLEQDHVMSPAAIAQLTQMLQVVVQHGSGYIAGGMNPGYAIAGKTGTAQIPRPDGKGYIDGKNIGSFTGFAPVGHPKFVVMVRINEPGVKGFAETTTVPVFGDVCRWLFKYYGIPPGS
jgi:cell division protein FtsI/penicillin-binding protein 2